MERKVIVVILAAIAMVLAGLSYAHTAHLDLAELTASVVVLAVAVIVAVV